MRSLMESHILQNVLDLIQSGFSPMLGRVRPVLLTLAFVLLFLEATRLATRWIFHHGDPLYDTFLFFLKSGIILFLLFTSYGSVFNIIYRTGIAFGLKAGGNVLTSA